MLPAAVAAQRAELHELFGEQRSATRVSPMQLVPAERAHLIERIAGMVETWSLAHPVLLALDDLHWADPATLATLGRLHRLTSSQSLVLVATYRPVPHNPELRDLVAATARGGGELCVLGPLDVAAVRRPRDRHRRPRSPVRRCSTPRRGRVATRSSSSSSFAPSTTMGGSW